jgi:hypothetical protein
MQAQIAATSSIRPDQWFRGQTKLLKPMSLIVALRTTENEIVIAADSMNLTYGNALGDNWEQYAYPCEKLYPIKRTNWVLAFAGVGAINSFHKKLEAQVELGIRPAFDPHIEIGGPEYLNALSAMTRSAGDAVEQEMPFSPTLLAGFGIDSKPQVLAASLPKAGYYLAPSIFPLGAQEPTANWIMRTLGANCSSLEDVKRLACFTIWQISKLDVRVGKVESGYPISLCVMSPDGAPQFETLSTIPPWMLASEKNLQECFALALRAVP